MRGIQPAPLRWGLCRCPFQSKCVAASISAGGLQMHEAASTKKGSLSLKHINHSGKGSKLHPVAVSLASGAGLK